MLLALTALSAAAAGLATSWQGTQWGESNRALLAQFGSSVTVLPRPLDFGDSYTQIVRRDIVVGGWKLIAFYQMDKQTGGLKRIQLERQRHGVNLAAFRGVLGGLEAAYGRPDLTCQIPLGPRSGYQRGAERIWRRDDIVIRAIFRDTTVEAYEGCPFTDITMGPCGLTGQLLVRISPPAADPGGCPAGAISG
ncbi:MAG: hypothetical protein ACM3JG_03155 [Thiohalocapsa sp.]